MTNTYQLIGMTCGSCEAKVKSLLLTLGDVSEVSVSKDTQTATISMEKHISLSDLQNVLGGTDSKYQIAKTTQHENIEEAKTWWATYQPIVLVFFYILLATILVQVAQQHFDTMQWMRHFMAAFFLVFSFFKMLNLNAFAESYAMYDIVAKKFKPWGILYAFLELGLGIAFLIGFNPLFTNLIAFVLMSVSIIGVLQSVLNKRKIKCACLGAVFNLPMSTVTIIEDALMIAMSGFMLFKLL
jgi:copper chaperone CopZ/uncharacterized membrane protein YphA (DoxX/SURF4 family)